MNMFGVPKYTVNMLLRVWVVLDLGRLVWVFGAT
jgi:hypothetical protein